MVSMMVSVNRTLQGSFSLGPTQNTMETASNSATLATAVTPSTEYSGDSLCNTCTKLKSYISECTLHTAHWWTSLRHEAIHSPGYLLPKWRAENMSPPSSFTLYTLHLTLFSVHYWQHTLYSTLCTTLFTYPQDLDEPWDPGGVTYQSDLCQYVASRDAAFSSHRYTCHQATPPQCAKSSFYNASTWSLV